MVSFYLKSWQGIFQHNESWATGRIFLGQFEISFYSFIAFDIMHPGHKVVELLKESFAIFDNLCINLCFHQQCAKSSSSSMFSNVCAFGSTDDFHFYVSDVTALNGLDLHCLDDFWCLELSIWTLVISKPFCDNAYSWPLLIFIQLFALLLLSCLTTKHILDPSFSDIFFYL